MPPFLCTKDGRLEVNSNIPSGFDFIAWIPCVTGKLLFRHFLCAHPRAEKCVLISYKEFDDSCSGDLTRYLLIKAEVDLKDDAKSNEDGKFTIVIAGIRKYSANELKGNIYILPTAIGMQSLDWSDIDLKIQIIESSINAGENIKDKYLDTVSILDNYSHDEYYKVKYLIDDLGFTYLAYQDDYDNESRKWKVHKNVVVRQSFYFLKYCLHRHQHHQNDDDSLTTIHEIPGDYMQIGPVLVNDLRCSLVDLKRAYEKIKFEDIYLAGGIISYANSLLESCKSNGFIHDDEYRRQLNYLENTKNSVHVLAETKEKKDSRSNWVWSNARSWFLFYLSIVAPFILLFRQKIIDEIEKQAVETQTQLQPDSLSGEGINNAAELAGNEVTNTIVNIIAGIFKDEWSMLVAVIYLLGPFIGYVYSKKFTLEPSTQKAIGFVLLAIFLVWSTAPHIF